MMPLSGKTALVTGSGRGIGKAIALGLSRRGVQVVLTARTASELEAVKEEIVRGGGQARVCPADLSRDADIDGLIERCAAECGSIDYLINNAGWGKTANVVRARVEDWDLTLRVNLRAPMILSKRLLPAMLEKGHGAIVNIASIAGRSGEANVSAYSAAKFGLVGFTQSLYEEVREHGIKVAAILPGFVDTALIPATARLNRSKMIRPEDVAEAVLFVLTSPATSCPVEIVIRPQLSPFK